MTPRQQRMASVGVILIGFSIATFFVVRALESNLTYFYSPEQIVSGEVQGDRRIRMGGLVMADSFNREAGSLEATFSVTDNTGSVVNVSYTGVLPDLFREGQGVVADGRLENGVFIAEEVLAKHDENYMSPQVAKMLEEQGHPSGSTTTLVTD